jgi:hypothetical protein
MNRIGDGMYLDTGTMIGIIIALVSCMLALCYAFYIIRLQDRHIERLTRNNYSRTKRDVNA